MKTVRLLSILVLLTFLPGLFLKAQDKSFKANGFDIKVQTLSNGKYSEFFDQETIVEIGTVLFNTETEKIVGYLEPDTINISAELLSRWTSVDPMAYKYSSLSPYCYVANNPLNAIDPTGKEIVIVGGNQDQTYNDLAILYATPMGRQMIDALQKSSQVYKIGGDAWQAKSSAYDHESNRLKYYQGTAEDIDGTSLRSFEILGHELYHAYEDETNQIEGYSTLAVEKGSVKFENYLRKIYSEGSSAQRLKYTGNKLFEVNEATSFDTNGEKRDANSVKTYVELNLGLGELKPEGDDKESAAKKDNTKNDVPIQQIISRIIQYMDDNKLQKVRVDF
jgi:hypothetical protein